MVTGDGGDSAAALADFRAFAELVAERYVRITTIGDFDLYLLRGNPTGTPATAASPVGG
jgi:hypothetical protein